MSSIVLTGDTSGTITVSAPAVAGTRTLTLPAATGTAVLEDASGVLQMNSGYGSSADAYGCRAWVNFNGTSTVAIRDSANVSSITDNGTGDYTVNFTTAMPDTNYMSSGMAGFNSTNLINVSQPINNYAPTTTSCRYQTTPSNTQLFDPSYVGISIFR